MNAPAPEFAPAAVFGKFPEGWNGRPLVMNHPVNGDGVPISANSKGAMESNAFGLIFNSRIEDNKLKTEAWINTADAQARGGEFLETLNRVQAGEMVEVSTGCFVTTMSKRGMFSGRKYEAVWIEVVPDHLAFLSEGIKGACSIEDGCGTPRSNKADAMPKKRKPMKGKPKGYKGPKGEEDEDDNGGGKKPKAAAGQDSGCGCGVNNHEHTCTCTREHTKPTVQKLTPNSTERAQLELEAELRAEVIRATFDAHAVPDSLLNNDISKAVARALKDLHAGRDVSCWLMGWTTNSAVYELIDWDAPSSSWDFFQISMDVSADGKVTFSGEPKEVNLLTRIVSVNEAMENAMPQANAAAGTTEQPATPTTPPAGDPPANTPPVNANATPTTPPALVAPAQSAPAANAAEQAAPTTPAAPKVLSAAEYIASAPDGVREMLEESMRTHDDKRNALIKALKDSGRCEFTDEELKTFNTKRLEKLLKLADVPTYETVAIPGRVESFANRGNGADDPMAAPPAPNVYAAAAPTTETRQ
ncbi:MAG: DUF2213 domain-containing protein [Nitrospiraceae bacterium]